MAGGVHLHAAGELARRVGQAVCAGVAGDDAGVEPGGCRSSANGELGDARNGRSRGWSRSTPGYVLSTVARSFASFRGCGHGYAMAGGETLRSRLGIDTTASDRPRGQGKTAEELTGRSKRSSVGSGSTRK